MTLSLDNGPKLAVGQWIACWSGLPRDLAVGGNSLCCLIIFVIFIGLGTAYSLGEILKLSCVCMCGGEGGGGQFKKGWSHFYGGSWLSKTPCKDFNLAIIGGLCCIKWLKIGQGKVWDFSFKIFKIMRSLRYLKCLNTKVELTFTI